MKKFLHYIDAASDWIGMFFLCVMCVVILLQIIARYALNNAMAWPEEIARFSFVWATYFAISICMKDESHLRITLIQSLISKKAAEYIDLFCMILNILFFAICTWLSLDMTLKVQEMGQVAVSIPVPVYLVWIGIPLGCAVTLIQSVRDFVRIRARKAEQGGE